jgi:hypothetical protein
VPESEALGGRNWSNYTWHGDQAPGHPFVHGLQASDVDFNELRHSKLHIQVGKNLVEDKMPESHFFHEVMERGGKIVSITPEYSPPAGTLTYTVVASARIGAYPVAVGLLLLGLGGIGLQSTYQTGLVVAGLALIAGATNITPKLIRPRVLRLVPSIPAAPRGASMDAQPGRVSTP